MNKKKKTFVSIAAVALVIIFLSLLIFSSSMTKTIGHDEHMYCTAGYMAANGKLIYRDYSYVAQLPYHPLLLGIIYKISSTDLYLLTGRLLSIAFEVGILVCIAGIYKMVIKDSLLWSTVLGISAMLIYSLNIFVFYAAGFAWNHSMVIFCIMLCLWLFLSLDFSKVCVFRPFILGGLLCVGTFTRPTTVLVLLLFAVGIFVLAKDTIKKKAYCILWFTAGVAVAAIWPVSVIIRAPEAFWLNAVKVPALNAWFLNEIGMVYDKSELTMSALKSPSYLIILITILVVMGGFIIFRKKIDADIKRKSVFCFLLTAVMFFIVFTPPTMWIQYWAMPVGFILLSLAYPIYGFRQVKIKNPKAGILFRVSCYLVIACALIGVVFGSVITLDSFGGLFYTDDWVPLKVHNISKDIVSRAGDKPILTMSPLYALEGGGKIFPHFSAGPFVYRIADKLSKEEKEIIGAVGFDDIGKLIRNENPNAVIVGSEPSLLEEPIRKCLDGQWKVKGYGQNEPVVYFR